MTETSPQQNRLATLLANLERDLRLHDSSAIDATAWFLGPRAENARALKKFIKMAIKSQIRTRRGYQPDDPPIFSDYDNDKHQASLAHIECELETMLHHLRGSIPLASYRNLSHMYWDITLPSAVGYFAAMLYNQNNVAAEASPVTTLFEIKVGESLCEMLGFPVPAKDDRDSLRAWGHITCDGSVANGEAMWAARNLKFLPVALAAAIANESSLLGARDFAAETCDGRWRRLIDMSLWELLNLKVDTVCNMTRDIEKKCRVEPAVVRAAIDRYSVQNLGLVQFHERFLENYLQASPLVFTPATAHYSWPKSAALLGLGTDSRVAVEVDLNGRMRVDELRRKLYQCLDRQQPVMQVVAVMGSTEEGAIDPLADIVELRREMESQGLGFVIHVDGAWGGYFTSMLREPGFGEEPDPAAEIDRYFPQLAYGAHFERHFEVMPEVDSVTLDPHKSGFCPYPAGGLCYRNGAMRDLISYAAPVVYHGGVDVSVGIYGIEGSKPGAAAAGVYLSHKVIPLDRSGYGRLLARCLFNSKRFYASLVSLDERKGCIPDGPVTAVHAIPFQRLPAERQGLPPDEIAAQKKTIREKFVDPQTGTLIEKVLGLPRPDKKQQKLLQLFREMGSDLSIVTYVFNFSTAEGINRDLHLMNRVNDLIFEKLSLHPDDSGELPRAPMFVTASNFDPADYGAELVNDFARRAGVEPVEGEAIRFLISTTQNPWLSTTTRGDEMLKTVIDVLRETAFGAASAALDAGGEDARAI